MTPTLAEIENEIITGQVPPPRLAELKDILAGKSTSLMDRQLELQLLYADYFIAHKEEFKSDAAVKLHWSTTPEGKEQLQLDLKQRKIKVLREAISSHLRVASDQARNLY